MDEGRINNCDTRESVTTTASAFLVPTYAGLAMKTHSRLIALLLVLMLLSLSSTRAAESVRWTDLPKKIGRGKMRADGREGRQYRVVTKDGLSHVGYKLMFGPNNVRLTDSGPSIPREQVAEIRIHRDGRLADALRAPGSALASGLIGSDEAWLVSWKVLLLPVLIPVALGADAAAVPVVIPIHAIQRHLPDKVIRVAP